MRRLKWRVILGIGKFGPKARRCRIHWKVLIGKFQKLTARNESIESLASVAMVILTGVDLRNISEYLMISKSPEETNAGAGDIVDSSTIILDREGNGRNWNRVHNSTGFVSHLLLWFRHCSRLVPLDSRLRQTHLLFASVPVPKWMLKKLGKRDALCQILLQQLEH